MSGSRPWGPDFNFARAGERWFLTFLFPQKVCKNFLRVLQKKRDSLLRVSCPVELSESPQSRCAEKRKDIYQEGSKSHRKRGQENGG